MVVYIELNQFIKNQDDVIHKNWGDNNWNWSDD